MLFISVLFNNRNLPQVSGFICGELIQNPAAPRFRGGVSHSRDAV